MKKKQIEEIEEKTKYTVKPLITTIRNETKIFCERNYTIEEMFPNLRYFNKAVSFTMGGCP